MSGSPDEKAGSAAAIEETAYDVGNVLGVAVLGSVAAVVYRDRLALGDLPGIGDVAGAAAAEESLGGALEIAAGTGSAELAVRAQEAFTTALVDVGAVGGVVLLAVAAAVAFLTPRGSVLDSAADVLERTHDRHTRTRDTARRTRRHRP